MQNIYPWIYMGRFYYDGIVHNNSFCIHMNIRIKKVHKNHYIMKLLGIHNYEIVYVFCTYIRKWEKDRRTEYRRNGEGVCINLYRTCCHSSISTGIGTATVVHQSLLQTSKENVCRYGSSIFVYIYFGKKKETQMKINKFSMKYLQAKLPSL